MNLHEQSEFRDAIVATASKLGIRDVFVEKDYWVTWVLWNLSKSSLNGQVVFKGGTSLSKAYRAIDRFSEDVDLAVLNKPASDAQTKKLVASVSKAITQPPLEEKDVPGTTSKGSRFRRTAHAYPRLDLSDEFGDASPNVIVEVNAFTKPSRYSPMPIQSLIGQSSPEVAGSYGLESFSVQVLEIQKTFVEKIFALVRASYLGEGDLRKKVRHFYDLSRLMNHSRIRELLSDASLLGQFVSEVRESDSANPEFQGDWLKKKPVEAPLFADSKTILQMIRPAYEGPEFGALVWGAKPSMPEVETHLAKVAEVIEDYS